ncbi:MAG: PIN domain-containing protein [Haloarculaceae archaeon]
MPEVVVDSNVVLSARNANAERHETAQQIVAGIDRGELPRARVLNYVVPEILHPLQKRIRKEVAIETFDRLQESRGYELVHVPDCVHSEAERLYRLYEDPEWVDAIIAAYMASEDLEYVYSFDDDFDSYDWIMRLNSAVDPFA